MSSAPTASMERPSSTPSAPAPSVPPPPPQDSSSNPQATLETPASSTSVSGLLTAQRRDAPLPPIPTQEPDGSTNVAGPGTVGATASLGTTAPGTTTAQEDGAAPEGTTPHSSSSRPVPKPPSPSKPVAGQKHIVKRREQFINKKSLKTTPDSSALPLHLAATPKKKRLLGRVEEVPVVDAMPSLSQQPKALRSGSDRQPHDRRQKRPVRPLRAVRAPAAMPSQALPPVYPSGPQVAEQPAVPQQVMHPAAMAQQQMVPQQQLYQQPQMYSPFMSVPPPIAYPVPMQPQNAAVMGYHTFSQPVPQQPIQGVNASIWSDYREARRNDIEVQQFSTPRHVRTRHVHYDLDDDLDDDVNDNLNKGEDGMEEDEYEERYLDEDVAVDYEDEYEYEEDEAYEGDPEDELEDEGQGTDDRPGEDLMEEVEEDVSPTAGSSQLDRVSGKSRPPRTPPADDEDQEQSEPRSDDEGERVRRKGKERATDPFMTPRTCPIGPQGSQTPQPLGDRALPRQEGGYFLLLLQQLNEFNENQREENKLNRQWQQNTLQYLKKLDQKISRGSGGIASSTNGHMHGRRVKAHRVRPSNSMASRIVLPPQERPISPEERERLEAKEKAHLTDLQSVVRVHLKKLLGVQSYHEMAAQNPPLSDDDVFAYEASGPQYFNDDNFRIDFVKPWKEFAFNLSARDFFANHLRRVLQGGGYKKAAIPPRYHSYDHIGDALDVHMEHARKRYREEVTPPTPNQKEREKRKSRMVSRRGTLYGSRFKVANELKEYNRFRDLFLNLSGANMSGDETDRDEKGARGHPTTYTITRAAWMSSAFRRLCREMDKENIESRDTTIGDQGSGGNGPRIRQEAVPPREAETRAPVGLQRNCYDSVWLAGLKNDQVHRLAIVDEDFDLRLPKDIITPDDEEEV